MVSLRFPFSFPPPKRLPHCGPPPPPRPRPFLVQSTACVLAAASVSAFGIAISQEDGIRERPNLLDELNLLISSFIPRHRSIPTWGSLSLADRASPVVESRTGASFPSVLSGSRRLLGIGLRRKRILGVKNIDVYAFGVYADNGDLEKFASEKDGKLIAGDNLSEELIKGDVRVTVRLQIAYGRLSIRSVRSAFEESVGSRLRKFGGSDQKELLQRFTSQFKDEYSIPQGSSIELSTELGHVLRTAIHGEEVGRIESRLLCQSILDLYMGDDPFDRQAKQDIELKLASFLLK